MRVTRGRLRALVPLLLIGGGAALLLRPESPTSPPVPTGRPAPKAVPKALLRDERNCLQPRRIGVSTRAVELPNLRSWTVAAASAARLQADHCGDIWALWLNSWTVLPRGDPTRSGSVLLPPAAAGLATAGVADFVTTEAGELWVLGRNGAMARYHDDAWQGLPALPDCGSGQLAEYEGRIWAACPSPTRPGLAVWNEQAAGWTPTSKLHAVHRLAATSDGRLLAIGRDGLYEYGGGPEAGWRQLARQGHSASALAADAERIYVGTPRGLYLYSRTGKPLGEALAGEDVTGIAAGAGVWVSVRNEGLRYYDGRRWHAWRYAQGLPDDDGRDVLLDAQGRLWVGGTPVGVIRAAVAAERVTHLAPVPVLPGQIYPDACAAAEALLGKRPQDGQIAQETVGGVRHVFFGTRQVCPDPMHQPNDAHLFFRRGADGALAEIPYNGVRFHRGCGSPCSEGTREELARFWGVRVHKPTGPGARAPLKVTTWPPPRPAPPETPSGELVMGISGRVWMGTRRSGLYHHDRGGWRHYGAEYGFGPDNPVTAMVEDAYGRLWVASSPRGGSGPTAAALHRFDGKTWRHWSSAEGLAADHVAALAAIPGGVAAATNGGLSLVAGSSIQSFGPAEMGTRSYVTTVTADRGNFLWLTHGPQAEGLTLAQGGWFRYLSSRDGLFADRIRRVGLDNRTRVWLLADDGRVAVYSRFKLMERMHKP